MVAVSGLAEALAAWRSVLGQARVVDGGPRLDALRQATFPTNRRCAALLEPADRDEVAACLRIATRCGIPLHPLSAGRNWGYGSATPARDGAVVLSLARLDRILDHDEALATVTLEPGVTFGALAGFLRERGSALLPALSGASPRASVVGNVLQRGIGKGPYEDMAAHACSLEVLLASGEIVHTGWAAHPGARATVGPPQAPGPSLQGLFAQGGPGVVTRLTLCLHPAPALRQRLFCGLAEGALAPFLDRLRPLLLRGDPLLQAECVNAYRVLAMRGPRPVPLPPGQALPPEATLAALGPGGHPWYGCVTVWAEEAEELAWRRRRLEAALAAPGWWEPPTPGPEAALSEAGTRSTYWRKPFPAPAADPDPDRDGCGVIWLAPVLPMRGGEVATALAEVRARVLAHGLEPSVSLRPVGGRALTALIGLVYDREEPGADERAVNCHAALRQWLDARGLHPYRLGLLDHPPERTAADEALRARLQRLLDPAGILSAWSGSS